jgi:hypothetical protein
MGSVAARLLFAGAVWAPLLAAGCSSGGAPASTETPPCDVHIDRFKEIVIVDESVTGDARGSNAGAGPWSFRHAIESMAPQGIDPSTFVVEWLEDWATRETFNGAPINREPRGEGLRRMLLCPWLLRTPANACQQDCSTCGTMKVDLALAPFRLAGIVNRIDLGVKPDAVGTNGEGRLIFIMTDGVGDDPNSRPLPMTVNFEYRLPTNITASAWAHDWHALGQFNDFGEEYKAALETLTNRFVARGTWSDGRNGSSIGQVRTNESVFNWIWQLREFTLDPVGALRATSTKDTPAESFNATVTLADFITANADKIKADALVVPPEMLGGSANSLLFQWNAPGIDDALRRAFAKETCNGCHNETPVVDSVFHVSPFKKGVGRLSTFLNDPSNPTADELSHRERFMSKLLCQN